jgi:hypothetical protein
VFPDVLPHIQLKRVAQEVYELILLETTPFLVTSNPDNPPGSFRSSDICTPHPTIEHTYKFAGRIDDCTTVDNAEKVLPLPNNRLVFCYFVQQKPTMLNQTSIWINPGLPSRQQTMLRRILARLSETW